MIHLHKYGFTENLGDAIQTIAALQCLDRVVPQHTHVDFVDRDNPLQFVPLILANGFLDYRWRPQPAVFCGVHCADKYTARNVYAMTRSPVGARDPYTRDLLVEQGADAEFIGCATLTFPRYTGPRRGLWAVDCMAVAGTTAITHRIARDMPWDQQIEMAYRQLSRYECAEAVWTSRLHVLLPCIAFGTPVCLTRVACARRFGIADILGVEHGGEPRIYTCDDMARLYELWLVDSYFRLF